MTDIEIVKEKILPCIKNTEWGKALDRIIKALEQEPKTNTWSIKEVADALEKRGLLEPKAGHWIVREDNTSFVRQFPRRWVECSHCGWSFSYDRIKDDYCSKCGARMSEVSE